MKILNLLNNLILILNKQVNKQIKKKEENLSKTIALEV